MKRLVTMLGLVAMFSVGAAQEAPGGAWGDIDADASGDLSAEEFGSAFGAEPFSTADADAGGSLDATEFSGALFGLFDADDDQALTVREFNTGTGLFWGDRALSSSFAELDADASGDLSQEEFASLDASTPYGELDADASGDLSQDEFTMGTFGALDEDDDDVVTQEEFDEASGGFGLGGSDDAAASDDSMGEGAMDDAENGAAGDGMDDDGDE